MEVLGNFWGYKMNSVLGVERAIQNTHKTGKYAFYAGGKSKIRKKKEWKLFIVIISWRFLIIRLCQIMVMYKIMRNQRCICRWIDWQEQLLQNNRGKTSGMGIPEFLSNRLENNVLSSLNFFYFLVTQ